MYCNFPAQEELLEAVEALGFEAKLLGSGDTSSLRLQLGGMTCSSCSTGIEERLHATPGVAKASVSLITSTAEVRTPKTTRTPLCTQDLAAEEGMPLCHSKAVFTAGRLTQCYCSGSVLPRCIATLQAVDKTRFW
jgi:copper chaperone CopZ